MKKFATNVILAVFAGLFVSPAHAETFFIFKASLVFPVEYVLLNVKPGIDQVVKKTISSKEIVNLVLGQPIDTKIAEPEKAILAFKIAYEESTNQGMPMGAPKSELILWDSTASGAARIRATIGQLTMLDFDSCYTASGIKGQGIAEGSIAETTADPSGNNKIFASTFAAAAHASHPLNNTGEILKYSLTLNGIAGRVHLSYTDKKHTPPAVMPVVVDGIVSKGTAKAIGSAIAVYDE